MVDIAVMRLLLCECTRSKPVGCDVCVCIAFGADVPSDVFLSFSLGVVALLLFLVISFQYIYNKNIPVAGRSARWRFGQKLLAGWWSVV